MFTAEERKEYGFGTFEEDLKATNDECYGKGDMAWEDVEKRARGSRRSVPPWRPLIDSWTNPQRAISPHTTARHQRLLHPRPRRRPSQ